MPDTTVENRQGREDLAVWLRAGRTQRKLSLEDVAKITKIQPRILDKLERGELDGLPAEVFVKGFVRSFAKCVGLDETEAIIRYTACASGTILPTAKALVESMGLARTKATGTPAQPTKVVAAPIETHVETPVEIAPVEIAPVEVAPIEIAPVEVAPNEIAPIEIAPVAPIEAAPIDVASTEIAPIFVADAPVEVSAAEPVDASKKKKSRKKGKGARRAKKQTNTPVIETAAVGEPTPVSEPVVEAPVEAAAHDAVPIDDDALTTQISKVSLETGPIAKTDGESLDTTSIEAKTDDRSHDASADLEIDLVDGAVGEPHLATGSDRISATTIAVEVADTDSEIATTGTWQPTMPPIATTPSVPWRRPHITASRAYVVPSLVIDDADPDSADREREHRSDSGKEHRLSFLPPILLDREDRSARQGGLTLAVIILLIAATLTLSYLMRRPSPSGDGVTMIDTHAQLLS